MLEVVVTFCLLGSPERGCREVSFVPGEALTPYQCLAGTEFQMAKWLADHPKYRVSKWTCARAGEEAKL